MRLGPVTHATSERLGLFAEDDLPIVLAFVAYAAFGCIMPAQADTFYHLRSGQYMWQSGSLLTHEPFSWTYLGRPLANHWWLTQLAFYGLHATGGAVLLTLVAGLFCFAAVMLSWRLTTGRSEIRFLALLAFWLTLPEWSVRPQVVSLLFMAVALRLVVADRLLALLILLVVWSNMHAVVVLGIAVAGVPFVEAVLWERRRIRRAVAVAVAAVAAPLATPFGVHYWTSMIATVQGSRNLGLQEYRSSFALEPLTILFWCLAVALVVGIVRNRSHLRELDRGTRVLTLAAVLLFPTAVISFRNVAFFAIAAIPAVTRLFDPRQVPRRGRPASLPARALVAVSVTLAVAFALVIWRDGGRQLGWRPFTRSASAAIESCSDRMYNGLYEGGQLIWFVPAKRVFVDGRVEAYPLDFMVRVRHADVDGDYRNLFAEYDIKCAVVPKASPLSSALFRDGVMRLTFADDQWTVFTR